MENNVTLMRKAPCYEIEFTISVVEVFLVDVYYTQSE